MYDFILFEPTEAGIYPTTETGDIAESSTADFSAAAAQGVSALQSTATTQTYTYSTRVDSTYYLSENTGHVEADLLLSIRNVLVLWFLFWVVLKFSSKIHNSVKSMLKGGNL